MGSSSLVTSTKDWAFGCCIGLDPKWSISERPSLLESGQYFLVLSIWIDMSIELYALYTYA